MKILIIVTAALFAVTSFAEEVVPVDKVKESINVRAEPDANSDVVGRLQQGASMPLLETLDGWYKVQLDTDKSGFVSADWARVVAETTADADADTDANAVADASSRAQAAQEAVDPAAPVSAAEVVTEVEVELAEDAASVEVEVVVEEAEELVQAVDAAADDVEAEVVEDAVEEAAAEAVAESAEAVVAPEVSEEAALRQAPPASIETRIVTGPPGPPGPPGAATIKGSQNFLVKFKKETEGGNSQIFDNGNQVGIGTTEPKQRLEVNGSIQIHEQNSSVAGLMITQSSGETGYIMHNRASTLTIGAGSQDRITVDREGNIGIGVSRPGFPLQMASGAHVTAGGVWTNSSSREKKENIAMLSSEQATAALLELQPVSFNYRNEREEDYVGFIAEDVPDLVASRDRQTLSAMDIVAVLTKVVQAQQRKIQELEVRLDAVAERR